MTRHASRLKNKRDTNERELVELWERFGCHWIAMPAGAGFDGVLLAPNGIHVVEVKNPSYRWKFTPDERIMQDVVENAGHAYNVIETDEQALALIGRSVNKNEPC